MIKRLLDFLYDWLVFMPGEWRKRMRTEHIVNEAMADFDRRWYLTAMYWKGKRDTNG